jgi:predicted O-methyltransferase YrrM
MVSLDELKLHDASLPARIDALLGAPAELLLPERLLLYALVRGLRPARVLEIGTHFGGSTSIIGAALDDVGAGSLVCIDPNPLVPDEVWALVAHHATMLRGYSPDLLPEAYARAGGTFDFLFIDGDHTRAGLLRDIEGVLPIAAPGAHLLFHDSHYWEVAAAIDDCVERYPDRLLDVGTLSTLGTAPSIGPDGKAVRWGGLRMLRVAASPAEKDVIR